MGTPGSNNVAKVPAVMVNKISPTTTSTVRTVTVNPAKPAGSITKGVIHTPAQPVKKLTPTLLDYATTAEAVKQTSPQLTSPRTNYPPPSLEIIKIDSGKSLGLESKMKEPSWDHIVSDILRSSIGNSEPSVVKPSPPLQRQNSNPVSISDTSNSFLAQFANFANAPIPLLQSQSSNSGSEGAMNLSMSSTQSQKSLQQQHMESDRQRQIKMLEQQKLIQQQQQKLQQQKQQQQQKLQQQQHQQQQKLQQMQSGRTIVTMSSGMLSQIQNSAKQSESNKQSVITSQSPMSLAMSKSIPSNQGVSKMNPKQLVNQFQAGKTMSQFSEAFIRQQLSDSTSGSSTQGNIRSITTGKSGQVVSPPDRVGHVTSGGDPLRKTSPQSQTIKLTHSAAQGKYTGSSHSVNPQVSHVQSHGPVAAHSQPTVTVSSNGRPATSLLKSLFGQAQAQSSTPSYPIHNPNPQRSPTQMKPSVSPQSQAQWGQGSSSNQPGFLKSTPSPSKAYPMPVNARPVPGYQSVKLSNLTGDQMTPYQAGR